MKKHSYNLGAGGVRVVIISSVTTCTIDGMAVSRAEAERFYGPRSADRHGEAQSRQFGGGPAKAPEQRKSQAAAQCGDPFRAAAPPARGLALADENARMRSAVVGALEQERTGRRALVEHVHAERPRQRREQGRKAPGVDQIERLLETVAAAAHTLDAWAEAVRLAQSPG